MTAAAVEATIAIEAEPATAVRGTVLVLPGRGDAPAYYRRLATRLAVDGYRVRVAGAPITDVDDVAAVWDAEAEGVRVVIGVDSSAGLLASALAAGLVDPAGAVFAGTAVAGAAAPGDELSVRSACPVFRGVVEAEAADGRPASTAPVVWPDEAASVPALVLHGEADEVSPLAAALSLFAGWDAEVVTVRGGLHDVLNDVHHRSAAAEIVTFLERLRVGGEPVLRREAAR